MIEGWTYYAFAYLDDPMHKSSGIAPRNGFIKQESDKLVEEAKRVWEQQK